MAAGQDYCFETVMSHPSHVDHLLAAKAAGYETHLIYVCTDDPRININRVGNRVAEGGHAVPVPKIVKRHAGSIANLLAAVEASDRAWLFDNSDWQGKQGFRLVAKWQDGKLASPLPRTSYPNWFLRSVAHLLMR